MTEREDDLRATAEAMIDDSQHLEDLEKAKLQLDASDPRYAQLAREIEQLVSRMAAKARIQTQIAEDTRD